MAELENYPWPNPEDLYILTDLRDKAKKLDKQNEYALVGTSSPMNVFEIAWYLRGLSEFLMDWLGTKILPMRYSEKSVIIVNDAQNYT